MSEKTDGVRYMMIITNKGNSYLTGRNTGQNKQYKLHKTNIQLQSKIFSNKQDKSIEIIEIFDGELIMDQHGEDFYLKYLIFDCILHFGQKINNNPYIQRLTDALYFLDYNNMFFEIIGQQIPQPSKYNFNIQQQQTENNSEMNIDDEDNLILDEQIVNYIFLCVKDFYKYKYVQFMFDQYIPTLPHSNDGLVFTKNLSAYKPGTDENIIKWKPPSMNTIDFLLVPNTDSILDEFNDYEEELEGKVLDLYVMEHVQERDQYEIIFFDFMITEKKFYNHIRELLTKKEGAKGIVAECKWANANIQQQKLLEIIYKESTDKLMRCPEYKSDYKKENVRLWVSQQKTSYKTQQYKQCWVYDRIREDKNQANNIKIAKDIVSSIKENLDKDKLVQILTGK
ncbi:mRNA capping enzyme alpha, putative [Ichthyophthirius multifiliis]|uniref:mRNA guanylyltransferase n=1 Tax=Ichthyophthirius multifiliis TaxID=5932 RepID=G0QV60_ICHMU|nr:mRNA capping enzyme alpha, putative [Ichthyophthirius multifiliis]EGR30901.1 mRNA capping enzyme alpha, putative [Ichthyophthirius multifiliis]|eukprot:XP_004032488.1 mRNA capping enzyme alpha, putative [Ichthyophthirius multifiliis]